jgi:DNA-3-methyladenine glycosylase II
VQIILEQQVSLASANAAFKRLLEATNPLTPKNFLRLDDGELRRIGFSRQKAGYVRGLSSSILQGNLNLSELENRDDGEARVELMKIKGIGPWTADIYLLIALDRPDVWPAGDLALVKAVRVLHGFPNLPSLEEMERVAAPWKPWRAVAARILWHFYLSRSGD